jgi:hypothetical protein
MANLMGMPLGYYAGLPGTLNASAGRSIVGPEQGDLLRCGRAVADAFRRPGIVARAIQLASAEVVAKEAPGGHVTIDEFLARSLPKLTLIAPQTGATLCGDEVQLTVDLSPTTR